MVVAHYCILLLVLLGDTDITSNAAGSGLVQFFNK